MGPKKKNVVESTFNFLVAVCLAIMVGLVFLNATLRYVVNTSIPQSEELSRYCFIWVSFLGAIAAFKDKKHVGVDLLVNKLKGITRKVVETIGDLIMLFALSVMFVGGIQFLNTSGASKGTATGIPFGFISVSIIIASVAIAVFIIIDIYNRFKKNGQERC